jgi:hypothetical protein
MWIIHQGRQVRLRQPDIFFTKKIAAFGTRAPMIEGNISRMIRTTASDPQARQ